jgi:hypothetical protein
MRRRRFTTSSRGEMKQLIRIRNGALGGLAIFGAVLTAPRLASNRVLDVLDPVHVIAEAIQPTREVTGRHPGFDTNIYPGDRAMQAWRDAGVYDWVGYYLPAPCHKAGTWAGKRETLDAMGWGMAVIYVGQQTWGFEVPRASARAAAPTNRRPPTRAARQMTRLESPMPRAQPGQTCVPGLLSAAQGRLEADDAIARTRAEGFPTGTVIFLDLERMERVPKVMRDYYSAWTRRVLDEGSFRPGYYAHTHNAELIYADIKAIFESRGLTRDPPFWIAGNSRAFDVSKKPHEVGHSFAGVWQGLLDVWRTHNGVRLPVDVNVAAVPSPSSPEYGLGD